MPPKTTKRKRIEKRRPLMPWQVGEYDRRQELTLFIPYNLLLICRITDTTPSQLIHDFLNSLEGHSDHHVMQESVSVAVNYFITQGYGLHEYDEEDIREMFHDIHALHQLFPRGEPHAPQLLEDYCIWRDAHQEHWFNKWFNKHQREL